MLRNAIRFNEQLGAIGLGAWTQYRLGGKPVQDLAGA